MPQALNIPRAVVKRASQKVGIVFGFYGQKRVDRIAKWTVTEYGGYSKYYPYYVIRCLDCGRCDCLVSVSLNNDPENLELWASGHGGGQRIEDLVEYCTGILRLYAPERLSIAQPQLVK